MTLFPIAPVVSWDSLTVVAAEKYIECSHFVIVVALRGQHEVIEKWKIHRQSVFSYFKIKICSFFQQTDISHSEPHEAMSLPILQRHCSALFYEPFIYKGAIFAKHHEFEALSCKIVK